MHGRADTSAIDEQWFRDVIGRKIATHPGNRMEYPFAGEPIFDEPLVGFVRGDDPLLAEYKKIIGPFHLTPTEIMAWQAEKNRVAAPRPEEISVVSFIMPITDATKKENARQSDWLSERWAQTRRQGEMFSRSFVREIVADLMARGVLAVSPDTAPFFTKKRYPGAGWASPWSHRHMAYAAGLGTFGAHDFLITEKGAAHRCGSFVVNLRLRPDRQRPDDIHAWCAHYRTGGCLACVSRCPTGAISEQGHDKEKCYNRVIRSIPRCVGEYHIMIYGCGLCSVGVPCESGIPEKVLKKK
ncbi:MAG: epoxyqueuosine reductase [Spirochaetes bacterium]|nr:epoxyqueuosine reductase [Spirochaetota bacterium]